MGCLFAFRYIGRPPYCNFVCAQRAVVVQLAERSLPIPEDPGSNPTIGNFYRTYLWLTVCRKDENKRKRGRKWPIFYQDKGHRNYWNFLYFVWSISTSEPINIVIFLKTDQPSFLFIFGLFKQIIQFL